MQKVAGTFIVVSFIVLAVMLAGCGGSNGLTGPDNQPTGTVVISLPWEGARAAIPGEVVAINLSIEAPDMPTVQRQITQADIVGGVAQVTLQVTAGTNRIARAIAFDWMEQPIGRGISALFSVVAGQTNTVSLTIARVATGLAIETRTGVNVTTVLAQIETQFKNNTQFTDVLRDTEKVWARFVDSGDFAYVYGSGRVIIICERNMNALADLHALEGELITVLNSVAAVATTFTRDKQQVAMTYLSAIYCQLAGDYCRTFVPGTGGTDWSVMNATLRVPATPLEARMVSDAIGSSGWNGNYKGSSAGMKIDGVWLDWGGTVGQWKRTYAATSPSAGEHALYVAASSWGYQSYFYLEATFSTPLTGAQRIEIIDQAGPTGAALLSKNIRELVLGP